MNHEIEFTRFACSRSKFSIFSLKKKECFMCRITSNKIKNKIQGVCHY